MFKHFPNFTFLFILLIPLLVKATEPLPKGLTHEEEKIYDQYIREFSYGNKNAQPPATPPRSPAEFEEMGGVIITWASYQDELREIVRHARERVTVHLITDNITYVQNYLTQGNVPLDNIVFYDMPFNSVWVRDYGPHSIYLDETDELAFADWVYNRPRPQDNLVPQNLAEELGISIHQMSNNPNRLVATGGNFMSDGHGTGFSSELIVAENPVLTVSQINDIAHSFLGIDRYVLMDELPFDNISHIDMHMKLIDEETILFGEFPDGVSDGPQIEENIQYILDNYTTCYGREYKIERIPMIPSPSGSWPNGSWSGASYRTFTNSLILNDLVLVPSYYNTSLNEQAVEIYQELMPGHEVILIDMEDVIPASGAIHCISKEIAATDPIFISHAPVRESRTDEVKIEATIRNANGIVSASVFYSLNGEDFFAEIPMTAEGDNYSATLPTLTCGTRVNYYISATNSNKTITKPFAAPADFWSFTIDGEPADFIADQSSVETEEEVIFSYTGCLPEGDVFEAVWDFGEGASPETATGIQNHSVTYSTVGSKTVSLTINGEIVTKENIVLVTTLPSFLVSLSVEGNGSTNPETGVYSFLMDEQIVFHAIPEDGWLFDQWYINGTPTQIDNKEITISITENINLKASFVEETQTGISEWKNVFAFNVYPNPTQNGMINIVMSPTQGTVTANILNMQGQVIYSRELFSDQWDKTVPVDLGFAQSGVYFVEISGKHGVKVKKLIIE